MDEEEIRRDERIKICKFIKELSDSGKVWDYYSVCDQFIQEILWLNK